MLKQRAWRLAHVALAESLRSIYLSLTYKNIITDIAAQVDFETPYPLEPEVAAAVEAAIQHHVYTWETLEDEGVIQDWLAEYFSKNNAVELPLHSYSFPSGKYTPTVNAENEKEVRACFKDDTQFELFRTGKDYRYGFASVNDAEYNKHYGTITSQIEELVDSGQVRQGVTIHLETVPIPFLQDVPLLEGKWLDRKVAELAEWGALLLAQGFKVKEEDRPLLASAKYLKGMEQKSPRMKYRHFINNP